MSHNQLPPHAQMMQFISAKWISKPIYVAAELGIADMLSDGPEHIDRLAEQSKTHAPTLYRIMRALASVGIFTETDEKTFALTPMAECLKTEAMRPIARMFLSPWHERAWEMLLDGVKTGDIPFEKAHGLPAFDWFDANPDAARMFNQANAIKAAGSHRAIIDVYDFTDIRSLVDIGGGHGTLMVEILKANPHLRGTVADLPSVIEVAREEVQNAKLQDRCDVIACDFFREIPPGADAYLMSHVLHDWNDEKCRQILDNCHRAMEPGNRLLIVECIIPPGNEFSIGKLLDLEVFVMGGGRERTEADFRQLLEAFGFEFSRAVPTAENISVIEARR